MMDYSKIKVGDILYECEYGVNIKTEVLTEPVSSMVEKRMNWKWSAKNVINDMPIEYSVTEGISSMYGPRLYHKPEYISRMKDGTFDFVFMGE